MSRWPRQLVVSWLTMLVLLPAVAHAAPPGWRPSWGGSSGKLRRMPVLDFEPLRPRDVVILSTRIEAPPAVTSSGDVVSLGEDGILERTGPTGYARWTLLLGPSEGPPALAENDHCYVASQDEQLYAVDGEGRIRWARLLGSRPRGGVVVDGAIVVVALQSGVVRWYATRDGLGEAQVALGASPSAGPARGPDHAVVVPTATGDLVKLDAHGVFWRSHVGAGAVGPVAIDGSGASYAITSDGAVVRLQADGALAWRTAVAATPRRSVALGADGVVYVARARALVALDAATGRQRWAAPLGDAIVGGPIVADDDSIYVSATHSVREPNGTDSSTGVALAIGGDGALKTKIPLPAVPVGGLTLVDHRLWVGLRNATLIRERVAPEGLAAGSPWPKPRGNLRNSGTSMPAHGVAASPERTVD